jgi:hypothetical protein
VPQHDYVNVRIGGGQQLQQQQQLEPESSSGGGSFHARQSSNDSSTSRSGVGVGKFLNFKNFEAKIRPDSK